LLSRLCHVSRDQEPGFRGLFERFDVFAQPPLVLADIFHFPRALLNSCIKGVDLRFDLSDLLQSGACSFVDIAARYEQLDVARREVRQRVRVHQHPALSDRQLDGGVRRKLDAKAVD